MELTVANVMLIAKQREIDELLHLASKAELVGAIGHLIHALQSERGASSIYLASSGRRYIDMRMALIGASQTSENELRAKSIVQLHRAGFGNAKIFSLMAWALLGLDALPELRQQIAQQQISAHRAVAGFSRLIAGLIALIFELADAAIHPSISRLLVAYFNFVQGKELAGQERAVGALCFASGQCTTQHRQRVLHLIDAQERNFQIFLEFSDPDIAERWQNLLIAPYMAQIERLRRMLSITKPETRLDTDLCDKWFVWCSERLTQMWSLQCTLIERLRQRCATLIADAEREQLNSEGLLRSLRENPPATTGLVDRFFDPDIAVNQALSFVPSNDARAGANASIMEMLQAQSERLAQMEGELLSARRALTERKTIERAKGILMARLHLEEEDAYKLLRKTAMDQNRRMVDVAEATLSLPAFVAPPTQSMPGL